VNDQSESEYVSDTSSACKIVACACKVKFFVEGNFEFPLREVLETASIDICLRYLRYFGFAASNYSPAEESNMKQKLFEVPVFS
jgi:hypothetical protein